MFDLLLIIGVGTPFSLPAGYNFCRRLEVWVSPELRKSESNYLSAYVIGQFTYLGAIWYFEKENPTENQKLKI